MAVNWFSETNALLTLNLIWLVINRSGRDHSNRYKNKIELKEWLNGDFYPRTFNGSWLSPNELVYKDQYDNLVVLKVTSDKIATTILVTNTTFVSISYYLSFFDLNWPQLVTFSMPTKLMITVSQLIASTYFCFKI